MFRRGRAARPCEGPGGLRTCSAVSTDPQHRSGDMAKHDHLRVDEGAAGVGDHSFAVATQHDPELSAFADVG
jgi:hypothetical protein